MSNLPLARTEDQIEFWRRLQPVNRVAASDTYKRTMSGSSRLFADNFAVYNLAARKPLPEEGANGRFIMAGLEKMLYPWFMFPFTKSEVEKARDFFLQKGVVKKFPEAAWQAVLDNDGYMPIDIYSLPGGQAFLVKDGKHVPMMSIEGRGALVSHLEPHLEHIFAPLIQATKARLFSEALGGSKFAEFGLRSDQNENNHVTLMMALMVGGGFDRTSDDQSVYLFPEYFKDVGTIGHEFPMAYQRKGVSLQGSLEEAYAAFVAENDRSALLPDVIHTMRSGLPAILRLRLKYQGSGKVIIPRFDSGDIDRQNVGWTGMMAEAGMPEEERVVEDGYNPGKARKTRSSYANTGGNPDEITVGAGGYFQEGCERDTVSLAYKRSATEHESGLEASIKFSDSKGKMSIPGQVRIYGKDRTLIVAQAGEEIDGEFLMQKVLAQGRITYAEDLCKQNARADNTWNQYDVIEYSPKTMEIIEERSRERDEILAHLER